MKYDREKWDLEMGYAEKGQKYASADGVICEWEYSHPSGFMLPLARERKHDLAWAVAEMVKQPETVFARCPEREWEYRFDGQYFQHRFARKDGQRRAWEIAWFGPDDRNATDWHALSQSLGVEERS